MLYEKMNNDENLECNKPKEKEKVKKRKKSCDECPCKDECNEMFWETLEE